MKPFIYYIISFVILIYVSSPLFSAEIIVTSPKDGFTTKQTIRIAGRINNYDKKKAILVINGIPQTIYVANGTFDFRSVVAPGINLLEFKADNAVKRVSFFAKVPKRDIKIVFIWDTPTFTDLWVVDPKGEKCYWAKTKTKNGGNLTYNDATYAPQIFTMEKALPGTYAIQAQYYSAHNQPITRVNVYIILYEGTPGEKVSRYQFTMTKGGAVYHITDLQID